VLPERLSLNTEVASAMTAVETPACFLVVLLGEKGGQGHSLLFSSFVRHLGTRDENVQDDSAWGREGNRPGEIQVDLGWPVLRRCLTAL